jgi:hypothetical protein
VAQAALARLEELEGEEWVRELYNYRRSRFAARFDGDEDGLEERSAPPTSTCRWNCSRPTTDPHPAA